MIPSSLQVRYALDHAQILAAVGRGDTRVWMTGEARDVHFVNDGLVIRPIQRPIPFPVVGTEIRHDALHGSRGIVSRTARGTAAIARPDRNTFAIGIDQDLLPIEDDVLSTAHMDRRPCIHRVGLA